MRNCNSAFLKAFWDLLNSAFLCFLLFLLLYFVRSLCVCLAGPVWCNSWLLLCCRRGLQKSSFHVFVARHLFPTLLSGVETPEEVSIRTISPACGKGCVLLTLGKGSVISAQPVAKDKSLYHNFAHVQVFKVNLLLGFTMTNVWMVFHTSLHYLQLFFTC